MGPDANRVYIVRSYDIAYMTMNTSAGYCVRLVVPLPASHRSSDAIS